MGLGTRGCQDPVEGRRVAEGQSGAGCGPLERRCVRRLLLPRKAKTRRPAGAGRAAGPGKGSCWFLCFSVAVVGKASGGAEQRKCPGSHVGSDGDQAGSDGDPAGSDGLPLPPASLRVCVCVCVHLAWRRAGRTGQGRIPVALCSLSKNRRCVARVPKQVSRQTQADREPRVPAPSHPAAH